MTTKAVLIDELTSRILTNKALEQYGVTMKDVLSKNSDGLVDTGIVKNKKPVLDYYYNVYVWKTKEDYDEWRAWALEHLKLKKYKEEDLNFWECLWGLKEAFLPFYKKEGKLF